MRGRTVIILITFIFVLAIPILVGAKVEEKILYKAGQGVSEKLFIREAWDETESGILFAEKNDVSMIYGASFGYGDFNSLKVVLKTEQDLEITAIPMNDQGSWFNFIMSCQVDAGSDFQECEISLRDPHFKQVQSLGIYIKASQPANLFIREMILTNQGLLRLAVQNYLQAMPYSFATVTVFGTPKIFGHNAFYYFLPIVICLLALGLIFKFRKVGLIGLLIVWVVIDFRMGYEFFQYQVDDYKSWVRPEVEDKSLRKVGDFYVFADWVKDQIPTDIKVVNCYFGGMIHFPRILKYYLYPVEVAENGVQPGAFVIAAGSGVSFNRDDARLYLNSEAISQAGEKIDFYSDNFFLFIEK